MWRQASLAVPLLQSRVGHNAPGPDVSAGLTISSVRQMKRKASWMLFGAFGGAALAAIAMQPPAMLARAYAKAESSDTYRRFNLFGDIFERACALYVERPDDAKLIEGAINGMLKGLDPHSSYKDLKSFRETQVQTRGAFGRLGIEVTVEQTANTVAVERLTPLVRQPSEKSEELQYPHREHAQAIRLCCKACILEKIIVRG